MDQADNSQIGASWGMPRRDLGRMALAAGAVWVAPQIVLVSAASAQGSRCPAQLPSFDGDSLIAGYNTSIEPAPVNDTDLDDDTPINFVDPPGPWPQTQVFFENGPIVQPQGAAGLLVDSPALPNSINTVPGPLVRLPAGIPIFSVFVNTRRAPTILSRGIFFGAVSVPDPWVIVGIAFRVERLRSTGLAGFEAPGTTYIHNTESGHGLDNSMWSASWSAFEGPNGEFGTQDTIYVSSDRRGLSWHVMTGLQYSDNFRFFVTHQDCLL